jgi:hypothetical protein
MKIHTIRWVGRTIIIGGISTGLAVEVWHGGGSPHVGYEIPPTVEVGNVSPMTNTAAMAPLTVHI